MWFTAYSFMRLVNVSAIYHGPLSFTRVSSQPYSENISLKCSVMCWADIDLSSLTMGNLLV